MADQNKQSDADREPGAAEADRTPGASEADRAPDAAETDRAPGATETVRAPGAAETGQCSTVVRYNPNVPNPYPPADIAEPGDRYGRAPNQAHVYGIGSRLVPVQPIPGTAVLGTIENIGAPPTVIMTAQARLQETPRQADRRRERNADRANPIARISDLSACVFLCIDSGIVFSLLFLVVSGVIFLLYLLFSNNSADETSSTDGPDRKFANLDKN